MAQEVSYPAPAEKKPESLILDSNYGKYRDALRAQAFLPVA
jgi:hypothetical protein